MKRIVKTKLSAASAFSDTRGGKQKLDPKYDQPEPEPIGPPPTQVQHSQWQNQGQNASYYSPWIPPQSAANPSGQHTFAPQPMHHSPTQGYGAAQQPQSPPQQYFSNPLQYSPSPQHQASFPPTNGNANGFQDAQNYPHGGYAAQPTQGLFGGALYSPPVNDPTSNSQSSFSTPPRRATDFNQYQQAPVPIQRSWTMPVTHDCYQHWNK
jgi:hypothetical protein